MGELIVTQEGNRISGTDTVGNAVSGVVSVDPYGFVVEHALAPGSGEQQTSIVYSEAQRQFQAISVLSYSMNGKRCRAELHGPARYQP